MAARRRSILDAARRCFARKGFHATTIADLCEEAGVSAGGLYTHFESKHAVVAALGSDATAATAGGEPQDLMERFRELQAPAGATTAQLDLHLWAASSSDEVLAAMVHEALDAFRDDLRAPGRSDATVVLLEALALGVEVQRALGRPGEPGFEALLLTLVERRDP